jgi:hypothetical protein
VGVGGSGSPMKDDDGNQDDDCADELKWKVQYWEAVVRYKGFDGLRVREICRMKPSALRGYMVLSNVNSTAYVIN